MSLWVYLDAGVVSLALQTLSHVGYSVFAYSPAGAQPASCLQISTQLAEKTKKHFSYFFFFSIIEILLIIHFKKDIYFIF